MREEARRLRCAGALAPVRGELMLSGCAKISGERTTEGFRFAVPRDCLESGAHGVVRVNGRVAGHLPGSLSPPEPPPPDGRALDAD